MVHFKSPVFLLSFLLIATVFSCKKEKQPINDDLSVYSEHITGVTSGSIKRGDAIVIQFANDVVQPDKKGTTLAKSVLSFSPSIEGQAIWSSTNTLVFTPKEKLEWGTQYTGKLKLGSLVHVDKKLALMSFRFETPAKQFQVQQNGLAMSDKGDGTYQLTGNVQTSDEFDPKEIEKAVEISQKKSTLTVTWEHQPKLFKHTFFVTGIKRYDENSELNIAWDGSKINMKNAEGNEVVVVPSLKDFQVAQAQVVNTPDQYIEVTFSDPLNPNADLRGLVLINKWSATSFKIESNVLKIYLPNRVTGQNTLTLLKGIESEKGYKLNAEYSQSLNFGGLKPQVRLLGNGVIVPQSEGLYFPFEAANLSAVDVRITKIFTNNIHSFLQDNNYNTNNQIYKVGRIIKRVKVDLTNKGAKDLSTWNAFNLDLAKLIPIEAGAIYNVELGFRKQYSLYPCEGTEEEPDQFVAIEEEENNPGKSFSNVYYSYYSDWSNQENPCKHSYYYPYYRFVNRNILGSNYGMIAKTDQQGKTYVYLTNLITSKPESGVKVTFYDYQNQLLGSASTDGSGMLSLKTERHPFLLIAQKDKNIGYLKIDNSTAISTSNFDVGGNSVSKGVKGFLYGERGVWRPGDSIYIHFILEDKQNNLPQGHPLILEIFNPKGQFVGKVVRMRTEGFIYPFYFKTNPDDPTGNWQIVLKAGAIEFSRSIQVETVKPNRLKVELEFKDDLLKAGKTHTGKLTSRWLHGSPAKNLKAKVDVSFSTYAPSFKDYKDYDFSTPYNNFYGNDLTIFDGKLDEEGQTNLKFEFTPNREVSGFLKANITTKVFESGGDFSINNFSKPFSPYPNYVGLKIDYSYKGWSKLNSDEAHTIGIATVNEKGEPVSVKGVTVKLFELDYRWWYHSNEENLASYAGQTYHKPILTSLVNTTNGKGDFRLDKNEELWGRHLLLVTSPDGHTCGQVIYFGWSWGRSQQKGGAQVLALVTEKEKFMVGETVTISFPANKEARALITFENGTGIIGQEWIENVQNYTQYTFKARPEMAPNIYVSVMLIQPHAQTANDLPMRLYGVVPIFVEDPETRLQPVLTMPDEVRPLREFTVKVREAKKRPMDYTIAIVDEGLLDITNFQTPDPWSTFYAREALGVTTYDLYNFVMGSFGSRLESMFAVGGSDALGDGSKKKAERFKPVIKVLGPYRLDAGKEATHKVTLPQYVGSVRAMVVTGSSGKYGNTEKAVPVREPLMVLATMPRVLSPDETVDLPVSVFAMNEKVKSVRIKLTTNEFLSVSGDGDTTVVFDKIGEKDILFKVKSVSKVGIAKVKVEASSAGEKTFHEIELDIRHPNLPTIESQFKTLNSGEKFSQTLSAIGMEGTNQAKVEISAMPPLNLGRRLEYLISYPHGCVEQTTSAVFPQLYLHKLIDLSQDDVNRTKSNVEKGIERLQRFQTSDGGFAYWPGERSSEPWATNYVAFFLLEAEKAGYLVPSNMKKRCFDYLRKEASAFTTSKYRYQCYEQAYRLYVLALSGEAQVSAMNRLRKESSCLDNQGKWMLGASYALAGMKEVAFELIDVRNTEPDAPGWQSYGSYLRDRSVMLQTLLALNEMEPASKMAIRISQELSSGNWYSTQTTAYSLVALANFGLKSGAGKTMKFSASINGKNIQEQRDQRIKTLDVSFDKNGKANIDVVNDGQGTLFVNLVNQGVKSGVDAGEAEKGLQMTVNYFDNSWKEINIENLKQGTDFMAYVTVYNKSNASVANVALSQMFPAGWEIINTRLFEMAEAKKTSTFDYRDIRDDRVYTYFGLAAYESKSFLIRLNASYSGEYYLSPITCEAMYDDAYYVRKGGKKVRVVKD